MPGRGKKTGWTTAKTLADVKLIDIIETNIHQNPNNTLDMNFINETYINVLIENGAEPNEVSNNYKKQLNSFMTEAVII